MYFWHIEKLKETMAERPFTDRETLPYFVIYSGLTAAAGYASIPPENVWDWAEAACTILFAIFGILYLYSCNGGSGGGHFLQRYFAIGWVVGLRWLVVAVVILLAFHLPMTFLRPEVEDTQWYDVLLLFVLEVGLYWRIGHHMRDLARRTATATPSALN